MLNNCSSFRTFFHFLRIKNVKISKRGITLPCFPGVVNCHDLKSSVMKYRHPTSYHLENGDKRFNPNCMSFSIHHNSHHMWIILGLRGKSEFLPPLFHQSKDVNDLNEMDLHVNLMQFSSITIMPSIWPPKDKQLKRLLILLFYFNNYSSKTKYIGLVLRIRPRM